VTLLELLLIPGVGPPPLESLCHVLTHTNPLQLETPWRTFLAPPAELFTIEDARVRMGNGNTIAFKLTVQTGRNSPVVQDLYSGPSSREDVVEKLEKRLGRVYARVRLGIEQNHEAEIFGQGINFFHPENWYAIHSVLRTLLKMTGLY
jgi:hypothetical protein